jgi:hypothetical protein
LTAPTSQAGSTTSLSLPELAYLLHLIPTTGRSLARERLQLVAEPDDDVLRSGLSALAARGGVSIARGAIRPTPENAVVAAVLGTANRWVEIGIAAGGNANVVHVVAGSDAVLVANRRPLGVIEFAGVRPGVTIAQCVMEIVAPLADGSPNRLLVNGVGFGASVNAVVGLHRSETWRLAQWQGTTALTPAAVSELASGGSPEPGWAAIGEGGTADLLAWVALTVGAEAPGGDPS